MNNRIEVVSIEELRPALCGSDRGKVKVLVHTTAKDSFGNFLCESENGSCLYVDPTFIRFLDSKCKFDEVGTLTTKEDVELWLGKEV